jgi:hypothetical protein
LTRDAGWYEYGSQSRFDIWDQADLYDKLRDGEESAIVLNRDDDEYEIWVDGEIVDTANDMIEAQRKMRAFG